MGNILSSDEELINRLTLNVLTFEGLNFGNLFVLRLVLVILIWFQFIFVGLRGLFLGRLLILGLCLGAHLENG